MGYINGMNRDQILLFPDSIDEYLEANNPVRFIDAYVESLNLPALGFPHAVPQDTGRAGYTPADMLKLSMDGYLNKIRASRKLEQETHRNVALMWLLRKLTPDFKTMADFRKDKGAALRPVCQECTLLCTPLDLFGRELVASDGSQVKAVHSKDRHFTESKLKPLLKHIREKIEMYFKELEQQDSRDSSGKPLTADELRARIARLPLRQQYYADLQPQLEASGGSQLSLTDPDRRSMKTKQGTDGGYNVQVAVDHKPKLLVEQEVTHDVTDQGQLAAMAIRAKATLESNR